MSTTNGAASDSKSDDKAGPGKPAEALSALVTAMAKASPAVAADAKFCRAIATGWHAREALTAAEASGSGNPKEQPERHAGHVVTGIRQVAKDLEHAFVEHDVSDDKAPALPAPCVPRFVEGDLLKPVSDLDANDRLLLVSGQLTADLSALKTPLQDAGQDTKLAEDAITALTNGHGNRSDAAREMSSRMIEALYSADYRLGKAYSLGWDLASVSAGGGTAFAALLRDPKRYTTIDDRLSELGSLLPAHAGPPVRQSLALWKDAAHDEDRHIERVSDDVIERQAQKWRTLITGEKAAEDELTATNLVSVAATTSKHLASAAARGIEEAWRGFVVLGITAVVLLAVGVALLLTTDTAGDIAGLSAVLGSAGLTWKGLGSTVGTGLAKFEQPAWDSAVDEVIAVAITPELAPSPRSRWGRHASPSTAASRKDSPSTDQPVVTSVHAAT